MRIAELGLRNAENALPSGGRVNTDRANKLKEACQEFEAMLMGYMMKSMRKTVTETDLFGSKRQEGFFRDMMDAEVCKAASRSQSMGIADMLFRQLSPLAESQATGSGAVQAEAVVDRSRER